MNVCERLCVELCRSVCEIVCGAMLESEYLCVEAIEPVIVFKNFLIKSFICLYSLWTLPYTVPPQYTKLEALVCYTILEYIRLTE